MRRKCTFKTSCILSCILSKYVSNNSILCDLSQFFYLLIETKKLYEVVHLNKNTLREKNIIAVIITSL